MVYIKSFIVGLAATAFAAVGSVIVLLGIAAIKARNLPEETSWGWDPISLLHPRPWLLPFSAVFCLGFYWEYRRQRGSWR